MTFQRAGDYRMAESLCRKALNEFPRDANLLCLLGASLVKQERAADAEHTLSRAARLFPGFSRAHEGLGEALILQGRLPEALEALDRAAALEPDSASIRMKRAKVLTALGDDDDATREFEASFKLTPWREQLVRGLRLQRLGNLREAEKIYRDVLVRNPDDVDALRLLAGVAMRAQQWGDAEALLERALEIAPDFLQGWLDLGLARQEQDRLDEAGKAFAKAMRLAPNRPQPFTSAGTVRAMAGEHDEAVALFERALENEPTSPGALSGLGHVLKTVGRQDEAVDAYRRAVSHHPGHGEAWWSLANLKTFRFTDDDVAAMRRMLDEERLGDEPRVNLLFALAKALEDRGEYEAAFANYSAGNALRRQRERYDPVQTSDIHDRVIDVFDSELFAARDGSGHRDGPVPVFIVGLPRSGSTLIEQILASHSQVEGTQELPDLGRLARSIGMTREDRSTYPAIVPDLSTAELAELGARYLERTARHRSTARPYFTDKLPNNFLHAGLLRLILPNAKIIDARRHPLDSCLGTFKQLFARGQPFSYDLEELGEFYLEYDRIMRHWDAVLPGQVLRVQYEDVVGDLETELRRILEFCGLHFESQCLEFHTNARAVKTASSEQVRQPIYTASLHSWRRFEPRLGPLIEILDPLLGELPPDWRPGSPAV